jgi:hypothetical protein
LCADAGLDAGSLLLFSFALLGFPLPGHALICSALLYYCYADCNLRLNLIKAVQLACFEAWLSCLPCHDYCCYISLLHCPRLSQYDCCLPFPCIHAQTMQHCQHPHTSTASNLSNLTWAGQQSATLCLWCSRMKTTNVLRHLLVPQIPHLTVFCTYNKTFNRIVSLRGNPSCLPAIPQVMTTKTKPGHTEDDLFRQLQSTKTRQKIAMHVCYFPQRRHGLCPYYTTLKRFDNVLTTS